ncbi:MAG: hypothetical protein AB1777_08745 [Bacteroidota bacterium]
MRRKLLIAPFVLGAMLALLTWGCEQEDKDVCQKFEPPQCEIANVCCPTDGGNCYYDVGSTKYYCDKSKATSTDPDGCDEAENKAIADLCAAASPDQLMSAKVELSSLTRKLMQEARTYSVCH